MNKVIIGLGSNIEPERNIKRARQILAEHYTVNGESQFIKTAPVGYTDQPDFINGAVLIETKLDQENLESELKSIEKNLGRVKTDIKYGPRTIDLDVIVWNSTIVDQDFYKRDFLKNSVLELLPELQY